MHDAPRLQLRPSHVIHRKYKAPPPPDHLLQPDSRELSSAIVLACEYEIVRGFTGFECVLPSGVGRSYPRKSEISGGFTGVGLCTRLLGGAC